MFSWNEKNINWFSSSAKETDFHKKLAQQIIPYINKDDSLLSLGSGLGFLERELSPYLKKMVLIDNNDVAIDFLNKHKLKNQTIINTDWSKYNKKADYLLLSFFSRMYINDSLDDFLKLVNKKIFYIVNQRHCNDGEVESYLNKKKANYSYKKIQLDFNQVLKKSEINDYLNQYYSQVTEEKKEKLLQNFKPYKDDLVVFNNRKKIILFIIEKGDK